ncbi:MULTISPECIES: SixA phosphatase family protein [unclassified Maribacter]|uniref:SixA phosphatase family protein n=1 Tax=unclassified Maribacter TaxID=2615042 RepID=UPI000EEAC739|nr:MULTISPECIES: phosphoglycerate mutase family protein [unclassified Maribacter]HAI36911.1 histidine phosphatase family protein [Maribacter sp.]|tara:strand:- start:109 stop:651 length:543 start_codon:yes stop_codon:yes gene_type:complete
MKAFKYILFILLAINLSCKDEPTIDKSQEETSISTFYLIRHAEKDRSNPDDADPELTQQGLGRAMHWAEILADVELDAIYSTDYNRTSMTAAPTSVKQNIDVQYYDPTLIDIAQFKRENLNKNVLIVGHSNTTPEFVNKLIDEQKFYSIDDSENGTLFIVKITNGTPSVDKLIFNCNCPK